MGATIFDLFQKKHRNAVAITIMRDCICLSMSTTSAPSNILVFSTNVRAMYA